MIFFFVVAHIEFKSVNISPPPNREDTPTPQPSEVSVNQTPVEAIEFPQLPEGLEKKPIVLKFSAMLDGITIGAALLPSLKAEYKMGRMKSHGMTGIHNCSFVSQPHGKYRCNNTKVLTFWCLPHRCSDTIHFWTTQS